MLLTVTLCVRLMPGAPACFVQERRGKNGRVFRMIKFRTMRESFDAQGNLLPDAERLAKRRRFLRSSALDELPELWNVLTGVMSLASLRPLLMEYLPLYLSEQARRHDVRHDLTGWAQVNGRNAISWEEKLRVDVWYVDKQHLCLYFKILCL